MEIGGRNEAARRRQSIALEKQRTYSTVEHHINQVKHSKDKEEKCEEESGKKDVITEERPGNTEGERGESGDVEDLESTSWHQPNEHGGNLNTPSYEK